jgi:hypothetical protein
MTFSAKLQAGAPGLVSIFAFLKEEGRGKKEEK